MKYICIVTSLLAAMLPATSHSAAPAMGQYTAEPHAILIADPPRSKRVTNTNSNAQHWLRQTFRYRMKLRLVRL